MKYNTLSISMDIIDTSKLIIFASNVYKKNYQMMLKQNTSLLHKILQKRFLNNVIYTILSNGVRDEFLHYMSSIQKPNKLRDKILHGNSLKKTNLHKVETAKNSELNKHDLEYDDHHIIKRPCSIIHHK